MLPLVAHKLQSGINPALRPVLLFEVRGLVMRMKDCVAMQVSEQSAIRQ